MIYQIYGREITRELQEIDYEKYEMKITGFIGKPIISRGNRNFENYYVNGRYIKSRIIAKGIEDAYRPFMMRDKYPFTALFIQMEPEEVDINVHPTKMELRFQNQERMYHSIYHCISQGLAHKDLIPEIDFGNKKREQQKEQQKNSRENR